MRALGHSSLFKHVAQQVFAPNASMQAVVDGGRRALLLLYDGWERDARFQVTGADEKSKVWRTQPRCVTDVHIQQHADEMPQLLHPTSPPVAGLQSILSAADQQRQP